MSTDSTDRGSNDVEEELLEDLDVGDGAEQVVGGKALGADPCEGGELKATKKKQGGIG
jgi:hypothetical protein